MSAAVEAAKSGDTVVLPSGNSVWVNTLTIPDNKKITLMGSGPDASVITTNASSPKGLINIGASSSRVSNALQVLLDFFDNRRSGLSPVLFSSWCHKWGSEGYHGCRRFDIKAPKA